MLTKKALIIAAGNGSRFQSGGEFTPKPLIKVAGLPLFARIILSAKKAGISDFVIVVGYAKDAIIQALKDADLGVRIEFVENPNWQKPNGLSVLAARESLRENFVLLMSDHVFDPVTLEKLRQADLGQNKALLAVDYRTEKIFDPEDATKVMVKKGAVQQIGKGLDQYNAVDTGMFLATPELFNALEEAGKKGKFSLSDGISLLARRGAMGAFDIKNAFWQDIDTPESLKAAEKGLLAACRKPTDGIISRNFNRTVSLAITRLLVKTGVSANHVTGFTTLVGIMSGFFMAQGDYWSGVVGGLLFKLSSILDGCDGELSKLKMTSSKVGQWLDTLSDNLTYLSFILGLIMGLAKSGVPHIAVTGTLTLLGLAMTFSVMFVYLIRHTSSGSLATIQQDFEKSSEGGLAKKFFRSIQFMIKRDFFALLFLVLALLGKPSTILWISLVGTHLTWMVLLSNKLGLFKSASAVSIKEKKSLGV